MLMDANAELPRILCVLFSELVYGSPDPTNATYMLNRGDAGLLQSLENVSASAASKTDAGGATIAAHVDHLTYGLSMLNRWAAGEPTPWKNADWTASWQRRGVTGESWHALRDDLRREADAWRSALQTQLGDTPTELGWVIGNIAHLAYHLGAIRQIDRATKGPVAEDELPFQS
jgi:hypothetical protein